MGKMQRTKGAAAEREFAALVHNELVDVVVNRPERNLNQTRGGGHDLDGLPGVALEIKRQEQLSVNAWWHQACKQAQVVDLLPVLAYRQSRKPWAVCLPWGILDEVWLDERGYFTTDISGFCLVYRQYLTLVDF